MDRRRKDSPGCARRAREPSGYRMKRVVFNGRFLAQRGTGVQRYARESLLALDALIPRLPDSDIEFVLAVPGDAACPALRHIAIAKLPGLPGHLWEQVQ